MAEGYKDFIAGTCGGFSAKVLDYPFDTVKVLLQTQNTLSSSIPPAAVPRQSSTVSTFPNAASIHSTTVAAPKQKVYRGAIHCLSHTIKTRGFLSLYHGISSPLFGSMAENAVLFLCYGEIKKLLGEIPGEKELDLWQYAAAGGIAGGFAAIVLNPFEVVKVQMQVMNSATGGEAVRKYNGVVDCVIQTIRNEGIIKGLYRGQTSLLVREIPGNFMWYGVYEAVCKFYIPEGGTKRDLGITTHMLGGAAAGVAYWTAFYPADTVGSQMRANPRYASRSFIEVLGSVWKNEGWMGLYRGWGITVLRAAPSHAAIFAVYESTMNLFRRYDSRSTTEEDCSIARRPSIPHPRLE